MAKITSSSTAEYFAKNLQQVGFSSANKAVLTTLKESVDNSLDACEGADILPHLSIEVQKLGQGASRSTDLVQIVVEDNGPGIEPGDLAKVFGEYLASSKFGRGQCSRGQQGIGISAATTWAQLTNARGVKVISKTQRARKAVEVQIDVDIKGNKGLVKSKESIDWDKPHGVRVEFAIDGRVQINGDGGLLTYLEGTTLVNPHLSLEYKLLDTDWVRVPRVSDEIPKVPPPTLPHPHTMKLGEFMTHAGLYGKVIFSKFLRTGFSRVSENTTKELVKNGLDKKLLNRPTSQLTQAQIKAAFQAIQETELSNPSTRSVLTVGEESLSKSIQRLGDIDFFSVVTRKPRICDFKPVAVEVALARFLDRTNKEDEPVQLLRFANRVPLQFDKASCAITRAIESVNWRSYGLNQPKRSLPLGPYVFAVSVVSPFIKFKNASKETIDSSDELVEEIRRALMQAGQKLSRHLRREQKEADLERKTQHIEQFGPILIDGLCRLTKASDRRKKRAEEGLKRLLGRDTKEAASELEQAETRLAKLKEKQDLLDVSMAQEAEISEVSGADDLLVIDTDSAKDSEQGSQKKKKASRSGKTKSKTAAKKKVKKKALQKEKPQKKQTRKKSKKTKKTAGSKKAKKTVSKKKTAKKKTARTKVKKKVSRRAK